MRAVPPFPAIDRVPSAEALAALTSRPVLRAAYASALGTRSQEGKGGTARSLIKMRHICSFTETRVLHPVGYKQKTSK